MKQTGKTAGRSAGKSAGKAAGRAAGKQAGKKAGSAGAPGGGANPTLIDAAVAAIDDQYLLDVLRLMVDTPSPTGSEGLLAAKLTEELCGRGLPASYQEITPERGNCIVELKGSGRGPDVLVYGHLDTTFTANEADDRAVLGGEVRPDLQPRLSEASDGLLIGLGAANPKGGDACAIAALDAIRRSGVPLAGNITLGLVAGGIHKRPLQALNRDYTGQEYQGYGLGCEYMLKHGVVADFALSTKPGYNVVWEEPGQCWFVIEVRGVFCYTGLRHVSPNRNPIVDAARLVDALEQWFPEYTRQHTAGQLAPQAAVGAIEAGWPYKPEFIPNLCHVYVSMNINSTTSPIQARRLLEDFLQRYNSRHPDVRLSCRMLVAQAGSRTDPSHPIVRNCRAAWEAVEGRPHQDASGMSGTSDGNILRQWGLPTVRVGLPGLMSPEAGWPAMFDATRVSDLRKVTEVYVRTLVQTCC